VVAGGQAGLGAAPTSAGATACQLKANDFASFLHQGTDPRTGLEPHQERAVDNLVHRVEAGLALWEEQRGTPDLIFRGNQDVKIAFQLFNHATMAEPAYDLLRAEAARRLKQGKSAAYAREIRIFNPTMVSDVKSLLDLEDGEPSHAYEFRPLWSAGGAITRGGAKVGAVCKNIEIRYTSSEIKGLEWTQVVRLEGFVLGFGLSIGDLGGKGKELLKQKQVGSASGPGEWSAPTDPRLQYLAPSFFEGADFTSPSASASANVGPAVAKKDLGSALLIEKGAQRLLWDMKPDWSVISSVELSGDAAAFGDEVTAPNAGAEVSNEFGQTSLEGETSFKKGAWGEIETPVVPANENWVPLHFARLYFDTGAANIELRDFNTVRLVVDAIEKWDQKPAYRGSFFKVEISGCHSQRWEALDDDLQALDEQRDEAGELHGGAMRREGDLLAKKEIENYELALARATNVHAMFSLLLGRVTGGMTAGVKAGSTVAQPTTHESLHPNPYSNVDVDRSVTILVSYQIFSQRGGTNHNTSTLPPVGGW
jgi:hypothetical protein